jgi:hypothetical protein
MYYPLSQITPNLYTNGEEYVNSVTKETYVGYYFKTSKGEYFTGRNTSDKPNIPLIPFVDHGLIVDSRANDNSVSFYNLEDNDVMFYLLLNNKTQKEIYTSLPSIPTYNPTSPSQQDYQIGEFRRYFCKKTNDLIYLEINKDTYDKLIAKDPQIEYSLYLPFNISWQITGDKQQVARTNKNIVELTMKRLSLPKFNLYLREDYTKYYK